MNPPDNAWMHTEMGFTTPTTITVCGLDLADDIMGTISFPDLAFRMVAGRLPDERESTLFNAVLVSLADHGITPTVLAARLTYLGAPEALQGAVAAGLLGGGSVFLGVAEDAARFLHETLAALRARRTTKPCRAAASDSDRTVTRRRAPHPRAWPSGAQGDRSACAADVRAGHRARPARTPSPAPADRRRGLGRAARPSPRINGAGVAGAALADLGFDWRIIRRVRAARPDRGPARPPRGGDPHLDGDPPVADRRGRIHRVMP